MLTKMEQAQVIKNALREARRKKSRVTVYDHYRVSVMVVDLEGKIFSGPDIHQCHEAAAQFKQDLIKWAAYFKTTSPVIVHTSYEGKDHEGDWEDVRFNCEVVGTDREITFKDMEAGLYFSGEINDLSEATIVEEGKA